MTIIVCGGRDYDDRERVFSVLDKLEYDGNLYVVEGGARGADTLAADWAEVRGHHHITVPADWSAHGRAAGSIRNQLMLDKYKPNLVIAFPGGRGTADMIARAEKAGVPVERVTP